MRNRGREKREDAVGTSARNRQRGTGKLSACVSDVLMTLRNIEQANQYGRHCVCTRCTIASPPRYCIGWSSAPAARSSCTGAGENKKIKKKKRSTFINSRPLTRVAPTDRDFAIPWIVSRFPRYAPIGNDSFSNETRFSARTSFLVFYSDPVFASLSVYFWTDSRSVSMYFVIGTIRRTDLCSVMHPVERFSRDKCSTFVGISKNTVQLEWVPVTDRSYSKTNQSRSGCSM